MRLRWLLITLIALPWVQSVATPPGGAGQDFLADFWSGDTIPLQDPAPPGLSPLEQSLNPEDCGQCHVDQYRDWRSSLHAGAMGPGILGQMPGLLADDPAGARMCWRCHTPLAEQQSVLQDAASGQWRGNDSFDAGLQHQGLVCAACHLRKHQRYGPEPRAASGIAPENRPHNGFMTERAFSSSAFCKHCHQFAEEDYRLNGKLLQDTWNEWAASRYAKAGIQCQDCHMPDRRHLWRGIHDPDMTRAALDIDVRLAQPGDSGRLRAVIRLSNTGAGHSLPTYVTPKLVVRGELLDEHGAVLAASVLEASIGREVSDDLSEEIYDTRIAPDDFVEVTYDKPVPETAVQFRVSVIAWPDHFYQRFYRQRLQGELTEEERRLLQQALDRAEGSSYEIEVRSFALKTI